MLGRLSEGGRGGFGWSGRMDLPYVVDMMNGYKILGKERIRRVGEDNIKRVLEIECVKVQTGFE